MNTNELINVKAVKDLLDQFISECKEGKQNSAAILTDGVKAKIVPTIDGTINESIQSAVYSRFNSTGLGKVGTVLTSFTDDAVKNGIPYVILVGFDKFRVYAFQVTDEAFKSQFNRWSEIDRLCEGMLPRNPYRTLYAEKGKGKQEENVPVSYDKSIFSL